MSQKLIEGVCEIFEKPVRFKRKNWLIRKLTKESISITLGRTVYISDRFEGIITPKLVMHESQHVADQCYYDPDRNMLIPSLFGTLNFYLKYAFPFTFTIPLLLIAPFFSLVSFLIALGIFAVSIPLLPYISFWRKRYELRGYLWNFLVEEQDQFAHIFSGWTYMRMDRKRDDQYYIEEMKKYLREPDPTMQALLIVWSNYFNAHPDLA